MLGVTRIAGGEMTRKLLRSGTGEPVASIAEATARSLKISPGKLDRLTVRKRVQGLFQTNAAVVFPTDIERLLQFARTGSIGPKEAALMIGNVTEATQMKGGVSAIVLSERGRRKLGNAENAGKLDPLLDQWQAGGARSSMPPNGPRFGLSNQLDQPLQIGHQEIDRILVEESAYPELLERYKEAVAKGEAAEVIAGKPYTAFFQPTNDLFNELEVDAFRRALPGFAQRPEVEQRSVASLAGLVSSQFPTEVPEDIRRRVAASLVEFKTVGGNKTSQELTGELRQFYHGRSAGSTRAPEVVARDGFRVGPRAAWGAGVYYANPTVSAEYAFKQLDQRADILSGKVAVGKVTTEPIEMVQGAHTRYVPSLSARAHGDYWLTPDPKRFKIQSITTYRPDQTQDLAKLIPDFLRAYPVAPEWVQPYLDRIDPARLQRALHHHLATGEPRIRQYSGLLLSRSGDPRGIEFALEALKGAKTEEVRHLASGALIDATKALGPARVKDSANIVEALLKDPATRHDVAVRLVSEGNDLAIPAALDALKHGDRWTQEDAADALLRKAKAMGPERAADESAIVAELLSAAPDVRRKVGRTLLEQGDFRGLPAVLDALQHAPESRDRLAAGDALYKAAKAMGTDRSQDEAALISALLAGEPRLRHRYGIQLLQEGDVRGISGALDAVKNGEVGSIKRDAAEALLKVARSMGPEQARQEASIIGTLLRMEPPMLRQQIALDMVRLGDARALPLVLEAVSKGDTTYVREESTKILLELLQQLGPTRIEDARPMIQALLGSERFKGQPTELWQWVRDHLGEEAERRLK